ncbi:MAG: Cof-type HAD-IIB family hydrolase [Clostridiales bacterium]|jgi:Cof subfamily protein (haloacid dehalogenase superfamily)|nr:Cof-type HAD-IIB family hydrolase [Clostridiales bacterium]
MAYRLILSDLDGTLLNSNSEVTPEVKRSVEQVQELGIHFALCSGRSYKSLAFFEKKLGLDTPGQYGIAYNGGVVYETDSRKLLLRSMLNRDLALEIADVLRKEGASILAYLDDKLYVEKVDENTMAYSQAAMMPLNLLKNFCEIKDDFSKILIRGEPEALESLEKTLAPLVYGRANYFLSSDTLLEFCSLDAHKGNGLEFLRKHLGISKEETIAIGDHRNDLSMLKMAGLGVAVKNAVDEAKEAADVVLDATNDENSLGRVLDLYIREPKQI